ncbi:MAG: LPP20 family lipoprotein [Candidatus Latescibacteria bacterium]|nr:LPP20 family lipoprotein [Candidatus Latescibacterota bacterium]
MKRSHFAVLMLLVLLMGAGCAGTKSGGSGPCPEWFTMLPEDPNYLFAATTATSRDLQLAVNKAKTEARRDLASQMELRIQGLTKKFDEEVGLGEDAELLASYTQVTKEIISQTLNGTRAREQTTGKEGTGWRACVLMELPIGAANAALVDKIKANKAMYTRFRASQSFDELENEVEKYEEYKDKKGM